MVQKEYKKRTYILLKINPLLISLWWLPESNLIDKIIVSTDDKTIATFSKENGTEVPYLRKKSLSQYDSLIMKLLLKL